MARGMTRPHRDAGRLTREADRARIGVYYPILDLTGAVWFERSGFVSEAVRLRSFRQISGAGKRTTPQ